MNDSQLVELILTLTAAEKEKLLEVAAIHAASTSKSQANAGELLLICLKHPWQDVEQKLEKRKVYKTLFHNMEFVDGKLEKVMVEAQKAIRTFLLTEYYFREENEFHQVLDFAEIIRLRGLNARYQSSLNRLRKMQEDLQTHNIFYYHDQYLLEFAVHNEESFHNHVKGDLNIPDALDALDMHTCLHKLSLLNIYLLQQMAANISVSETMKTRLEDHDVPPKYLALSPAIKINYTIFNLLKKAAHDPSDVQYLYDLLQVHEKNLDGETLQRFYTYLRNICALILTADPEQEAINMMHLDLYKDNLNRGYLHYEGKLHPSRYLAISECAIKAKNYDWAIAFIEKYKDDIIGENETRDIYRLNKAYFLFGIGQYSDCLDHIPPTSPFVDYLLTGKRLELKAYFELQSDLLHFKLDAFKMFLSRTSQKLLPSAQRQRNVDFANLLFQIISAPPGDTKRAARLAEKVAAKKQAADWRWLRAKAKELTGG